MRDQRFGRVDGTKEFGVGWFEECGSLDLLYDSFLGADDGSIIESVEGEVDLRQGEPVPDGFEASLLLLELGSK